MHHALGGALALGAVVAVSVVASHTFAGSTGGPSNECLERASTYFDDDIVSGTELPGVAIAGDSSMVAVIDCGTAMVDLTPRLPLLDGVHPVGRTDVIGDDYRDAILFYAPVGEEFATLEGLAEPVRFQRTGVPVATECVTSPSTTITPITCGYFAVFDWNVKLSRGSATPELVDVTADAGHVVVLERQVTGDSVRIRIGVSFGDVPAIGIRLDGVDPDAVDVAEIVVHP